MIKSLDECEDMKYAELFQVIQELLIEIKGPGDFETWKDAAIDERVKRVKAEQLLKEKVQELDTPGWTTIRVKGFTELFEALLRADSKGYLPYALEESWNNFDYRVLDK